MSASHAMSQTVNSTPKCDIFGLTPKEAIVLDGSPMSGVGKWWGRVKSFEITNAHILLSAVVLVSFLGIFAYVLSRRFWILEMDGHRYNLVGVAQTDNNGEKIYMPLFKEIK